MIKGKQRVKRITAAAMALSMALSSGTVFAMDTAEVSEKVPVKTKVIAHIRGDFSFSHGGRFFKFYDQQNEEVHPVMYNDVLYLPVRQICGIAGQQVEWVEEAKTVYIGRTLSSPSKTIVKQSELKSVKPTFGPSGGEQTVALAYLRRDVLIFKDFSTPDLGSKAEKLKAPLICNGTTYLPYDILETFSDQKITVNYEDKNIIIGTNNRVGEPRYTTQRAAWIAELYKKQAEVYDRATAKIVSVKNLSKEELKLLKNDVAKDYRVAQQYKRDMLNRVNQNNSEYTEDERNALNKIAKFAEACEYYVLIVENIIYLASEGIDYSSMDVVFLENAMNAHNAMEASAAGVEKLVANPEVAKPAADKDVKK